MLLHVGLHLKKILELLRAYLSTLSIKNELLSASTYKLEFLWRYSSKYSLFCFQLRFFSRKHFSDSVSVLHLVQMKKINKQGHHSCFDVRCFFLKFTVSLFFYTCGDVYYSHNIYSQGKYKQYKIIWFL